MYSVVDSFKIEGSYEDFKGYVRCYSIEIDIHVIKRHMNATYYIGVDKQTSMVDREVHFAAMAERYLLSQYVALTEILKLSYVVLKQDKSGGFSLIKNRYGPNGDSMSVLNIERIENEVEE